MPRYRVIIGLDMSKEKTLQHSEIAGMYSRHKAWWLSCVVLVVGALLTAGVLWQKDNWMRLDLLSRAKVAALGVNPEAVKSLSGSIQDLHTPAYEQIKQFLMLVQQTDPAIRFATLIKRRPDGTIIILADSVAPGSADYSPPGDVYHEADASIVQGVGSEISAVFGPVEDRWGTWIACLIPVVDRQGGDRVAALSVVVDVRSWRLLLVRAAIFPVALTLIFLVLIWVTPRRRADASVWSPGFFDHYAYTIQLAVAGLLLSGFVTWSVYQFERQQLRDEFYHLVEDELYRFYYSLTPDQRSNAVLENREEADRRMMTAAGKMWNRSSLHYRLSRMEAGKPDETMITTCPLLHPLTDLRFQHPVGAFGSFYQVELHPGPDLLRFYPVRAAILAAILSLVITAALMVLLGAPLGQRKMLERMVEERAAKLKESEERYQMLARQSLTMTWDVDLEGKFTYVSDVSKLLLGYDPGEIIGKKYFYDLCPPEDQEAVKARGLRIIAEGRVLVPHEVSLVSKNGRLLNVRSSGFPIKDEAGRITGYRGWDTDFTDLKNAELEQIRLLGEARQREQQLLRLSAAIEQSADSVVVTNVRGDIEYVNPAFERVTGYTRIEALGQNPRILKSGLQDAAFYKNMWETILAGKVWAGQLKNRRKDGGIYTEQASIAPVRNDEGVITHMVAIKRDITQELEREDFIRQAQKMDSIGLLAGGIAHDFNNMLAVILGNASLLAKKLSPEHHELRDEVDEILKAAKRSTDLTKQLLTFARRQPVKPQVLDLNKNMDDAMGMIRRLIEGHISLTFLPSPEPALISIDPSQLDQIVLNLCSNACDAMPRGGSLTLEVTTVTVTAERLDGREQAKPGDYILLAVRDTGAGIEPEHLKRIFEPFYTTKPKGKGTGLGLATVYGVIRQNKGFVQVCSTLGKGTTFEVYLPRQAAITPEEETKAKPVRGHLLTGKTILLVEDEQNVLSITTRMLEDIGCRVHATLSPLEAIRIMKEHRNSIDMLITDVVMPELNGQELIDEISKIKPGVICLFISGYTADFIRTRGARTNETYLLQKPFTSEQLINAMNRALGAGATLA